jgi:DNA-binding transcriptional regulator YdaS (Cro superfamily)
MNRKETVTYGAAKALGGQVEVAALVGIRQQSVGSWVKSNRIPAKHVLKVEEALKAVGSSIDRHDLRPDVFGVRLDLIKSA